VVVINPTWETMALSVINRPVGATMELSTIAKIHKYRGLHEGHDTLGHDMDRFIKECAYLFHDR